MYIKTTCSECGKSDYHDIHWWIVREVKHGQCSYKVDEMEVCDTVSDEELAHHIVRELKDYIHNGMTTDEFCRILKMHFGVASKYCCDLIQKMKVELDMYCPDHRHLYFVDA